MRGRLKRRWLDTARDNINKKGLLGEERRYGTTVLLGVRHRTSTHVKVGIK